MEEIRISEPRTVDNIESGGKVTFEAGLGEIEIVGSIRAHIGVVLEEGVSVHVGGNIYSEGDICIRDGNLSCDSDIFSKGNIRNYNGNIHSEKTIHCIGNLRCEKDIYGKEGVLSRGYIFCKGNIHSESNISFMYHLGALGNITCKALRISAFAGLERAYWIEKMNLFGFANLAKIVEEGNCFDDIRENFLKIDGIETTLMNCPYWAAIEKAALLCFVRNGLTDYRFPSEVIPFGELAVDCQK